MAKKKVKAIIFDCFGVLTIDAQQSYYDRFTREQSHEFYNMNQMRDHGYLDQDSYFIGVSRLSGDPVEKVRSHFLENHHLNEELLDFIRAELKSSYKIGMLSNMGRGWIDDFFGAQLLEDVFDAVVLSGEEGITKPDRLMYERTAERLGVEPEACIMVDDIEGNCTGAREVGMQAILFEDTPQTIRALKQKLYMA